jgi:hypothetical protein
MDIGDARKITQIATAAAAGRVENKSHEAGMASGKVH